MQALTQNTKLGMATRLFPAVGPMLLISMGYIDPAKWSAVVEAGARFGHDLLFLIFVFSCAAILCQYMAARIAVVTQKNLAQICSEEYSRCTCIFLAIQAEVSVIVLDLTMILGIAHGLNLLFGLNLSVCLLFTATDIVLFPLFTSLLVKHKAEVIFVSIAGFVLASYIFGVLISRPEIPVVLTGPRLSGESLFALMSLLGANIMPHNFYVHSSIIQKQKAPANISKGALCHDHFFAILSIYSFIYLVNCAVMNSAATVFHSAGLLALTFQDIFLLLDQVLRNPMALVVLFFIMFVSSHITSLTWNFDGQVVLHELLRIDPPIWVHRATIRMFVIFVSLYSTWNSGAERIYQLLVFTQVILAMLLPSSFIPLFRVASSKPIMGDYKISQLVEFLALITLLGMLVLNIIFVIEMLFGHSDWVGDFWWNMGSSMSLPYIVLLTTAFASLVFMLWLAATPLKSATVKADSQWNCVLPRPAAEYYAEETNEASDSSFQGEGFTTEEQPLEKFVDTRSDYSHAESVFDLPESLQRSEQVLELPLADENFADQASSKSHLEATPPIDFVPDGMVDKDVAESVLPDDDTSEGNELLVPVGKTMEIDAESTIEKDEDHVNVWEPEESYREASGPTSTSEGPGSFRSLSGKSDESGNGPGSLSRLSGLGRAARRQLAAILDEFWGQLYDFHGQATREAKLKQLDILFGLDPKSITPQKTNLVATSPGYFPSGTERGAALPFTSNMYDSSKQQRMVSSIDSPYGFQTGSTPWTTDLPYMEGYVPKSSCSVQDSGERRYSSLRLPPSSESWDYQPATVHGYQFSSYLSRIATDRSSDPLNTLLDSPTAKSPSYISASYRDPLPYAFGQNSQSLVSSLNTSTMYSPVMSRNSRLQADKPYYDPSSYGSGENVGSPGNTKKYHSLPDISGLAVPRRDSNLNDRISKWNAPPGFGPSVSKAVHERSLHSNTGSRAGVPLAYDDLSSSKMYREAYTMQSSLNSDAKSLWSKQPFEHFGVAGIYDGLGDEVGSKPTAVIPRSTSRVDSETELLKSFRHCIMKLLKLEGCDWLFKQNGGADEDLIDRVAASEKLHSEAELRDLNKFGQVGDFQFFSSDRKYASASKIQNADVAKFLVSSVSYCGDGCIWQVDLVVSFGVWCIHRILELSLMESRPELWGKYTYVLNRLQGILDPAFSKLRTPMVPCLCIEMAGRKSSPPPPAAAAANGGQLPPTAKPGKGTITTASTVLEMIKDVEIAVSCRKGRTGTAAGDVAFPKGKENLASVLKRYKRRLALYNNNKPLK